MATAKSTAKRSPSKNDILMQQVIMRGRTRMAVIRGLTLVFGISATAVPLYFFYLIANTLSGKETIVSFGLIVGISATIVVGGPLVALIVCHTKGRQQKKELVRLRSRIQDLEAKLGIGSDKDESASNLGESK